MRKSLVLTALCAIVALTPACRKPRSTTTTADGGEPAPEFDRGKLIAALGECTLSTYRALDVAAKELATATDKLATSAADADRTAARDAWNKTIDVWQQAKLMQIGPVLPATSPGGRDLRDQILYPAGRCLIDQLIVAKGYEDPSFTSTALVSTVGLEALEYLLFFEETTNGCAETASINTSGEWAAITPDELAARKRAYAKVLGRDLTVRTAALLDAWDPSKGRFLTELTTAGKGSTLFPTEKAALNAFTDSLFYLDKNTKDDKLGSPLGLTPECPMGPCPLLFESRWAKRSKEHVRNNVLGFHKMFAGCGADGSVSRAAPGFDDLLVAIGAGSLAEEMDADVVAALAGIDAFPHGTLENGLAKDPPSVRKLYDLIKEITDALKGEFIGILTFTPPKEVAGDAD